LKKIKFGHPRISQMNNKFSIAHQSFTPITATQPLPLQQPHLKSNNTSKYEQKSNANDTKTHKIRKKKKKKNQKKKIAKKPFQKKKKKKKKKHQFSKSESAETPENGDQLAPKSPAFPHFRAEFPFSLRKLPFIRKIRAKRRQKRVQKRRKRVQKRAFCAENGEKWGRRIRNRREKNTARGQKRENGRFFAEKRRKNAEKGEKSAEKVPFFAENRRGNASRQGQFFCFFLFIFVPFFFF
jgi:hypothetical protein